MNKSIYQLLAKWGTKTIIAIKGTTYQYSGTSLSGLSVLKGNLCIKIQWTSLSGLSLCTKETSVLRTPFLIPNYILLHNFIPYSKETSLFRAFYVVLMCLKWRVSTVYLAHWSKQCTSKHATAYPIDTIPL